MEKPFEVKFLKDLSNLKSVHFMSISNLDDIRYIFQSKEWVNSFVSTYGAKNFVTLSTRGDHPFCFGLQKLSSNSNTLVPIGSPYNDYNHLSSGGCTQINLVLSGLEELLGMGCTINIDLLFDTSEINELTKLIKYSHKKFKMERSQIPSVYCEYLSGLNNEDLVDQKFSKKLLGRIKRQIVRKKFTIKIVSGTDANFSKSLQEILYRRKINFFSLSKKDTVSAFSPTFDKFMLALTGKAPVRTCCCIYELLCDGEYAASDLFFYKDDIYLCYLRTYNRKFSKLSPGMLLTYLSHLDLARKFKKIIIDYTRGDESYKFRIGGKYLTLYRLVSQ